MCLRDGVRLSRKRWKRAELLGKAGGKVFYIKNDSDIIITKGDTACIQIELTDETDEPLSLSDGDRVKIQVRDWKTDGILLFEGTVTLDAETSIATWYIHPEDTKRARPGKTYYWDGEIELASGEVYTFVEPSGFEVLPEITKKDGGA